MMDYCDNEAIAALFFANQPPTPEVFEHTFMLPNGTNITFFDEYYHHPLDEDIESDNIITTMYSYFCPAMLIGCIIGLLLNLILIIVTHISSSKVPKTPILRLSLNLALTDAMASFVSGISVTLNTYLPFVFDYHIHACLMLTLEAFRLSAFMASTFHLLALAIAHYRGITNPIESRSRLFCSGHITRSIYLVSAFCWIFPIIFFSVYFSLTPCQGFQSADCEVMFLVSWRFRFILTGMFVIPLIIMLGTYSRVYLIIHSRPHLRTSQVHKSSVKRKKSAFPLRKWRVSLKPKAHFFSIRNVSRRPEHIAIETMSKTKGTKAPTNTPEKISALPTNICTSQPLSSQTMPDQQKTEETNGVPVFSDIQGESIKNDLIKTKKRETTPYSQNNRRAFATTLIILGTYLLCWMPAVTFYALTCADGCPLPLFSIPLKTRVVLTFFINSLVILKAIVDPFIYSLRTKQILQVFRKFPRNCVHSPPTTSSRATLGRTKSSPSS